MRLAARLAMVVLVLYTAMRPALAGCMKNCIL
jgi:hypothetical protein